MSRAPLPAKQSGTRSAETFRASGQKHRANKPDTRPLPTRSIRSKNPCKQGAIHTGHRGGIHKSPRAAEVLKEAKSWFLFLPPYSPDLNPIEQAFSKLKAHLRRIGARTYDDLVAAIGDVCPLFDPTECWNFFSAAGYASD